MLSLSLDVQLKLSKMTSPQRLFDYDCITLYIKITCKTYSSLASIAHIFSNITINWFFTLKWLEHLMTTNNSTLIFRLCIKDLLKDRKTLSVYSSLSVFHSLF